MNDPVHCPVCQTEHEGECPQEAEQDEAVEQPERRPVRLSFRWPRACE